MAHGDTKTLPNGLTAFEVNVVSGTSDASLVAAQGAGNGIRAPRGLLTITGPNDGELQFKTADGNVFPGVIVHVGGETTRVAIEPDDGIATDTANKALVITRDVGMAIRGRIDANVTRL